MARPAIMDTDEYRSAARNIGAALRKARVAASLSMRDVHKARACDKGYLHHIETGDLLPSVLVLLRLCWLYQVYPGTILEGALQ